MDMSFYPVSNGYFFDTQTSLKQSKEIFVAKNVFFLLICLHLHLVSHQEADIHGEKNLTYLTLNIFLIFDFITYS